MQIGEHPRTSEAEARLAEMEAEFRRVVSHVDRAPADPDVPDIDVAAFGEHALLVQRLLERYRAWTKRVYAADVFPTHGERRAWQRSFIERYGEEGAKKIRERNAMNKYKIAPTSGLWTMLDALLMRLEGGDDDDAALAKEINETFSERAYKNLYRDYHMTSNEEKRAANTAFARRLAEVFDVLAEEADRRSRARKIA